MGFGNEDWLFRDEWEIGGWRYAFLQGVNKSQRALLRTGESFNVLLFTVNPDTKERFYVAQMNEVECLTPEQAHEASLAFKRRGWLKQMRSEIAVAQGQPDALGNGDYTDDMVNVRFRLASVTKFLPLVSIPEGDPVVANPKAFTRFRLLNLRQETQDNASKFLTRQRRTRSGQTSLPEKLNPKRRNRGGFSEVSLEHLQMQRKLLEVLKLQCPQDEVIAEEDYMDVIVLSNECLSIYEIKSDLHPVSVIRQAMGQLLEYAFYRSRPARVTKLFIVGRRAPDAQELCYLEFLKEAIRLPVENMVIEI